LPERHVPEASERHAHSEQAQRGSVLLLLGALLSLHCAGFDSTQRSETPPSDEAISPQSAEVTRPLGPEVEVGDTGCIFAGRYSVPPAALLELNELNPDPDARLPIGRQLALPVDAPALYQLRPGDTLTSLGRYFGVSVEAFVLWNDLSDAHRLRAGTLLTIPPDARTACPPDPVPSVAAAPPDASRPGSVSSGDSDLRVVAIDDHAEREALEHARTTVGAAEDRYRSADFPGALSLVDVARHILRPLPPSEDAEALAAQATWISGLALVGLDRNEEAVEAFRFALERDPSLEPDLPLSPKVATLVEAARAKLPSGDDSH
jgi:LysM repeat protein